MRLGQPTQIGTWSMSVAIERRRPSYALPFQTSSKVWKRKLPSGFVFAASTQAQTAVPSDSTVAWRHGRVQYGRLLSARTQVAICSPVFSFCVMVVGRDGGARDRSREPMVSVRPSVVKARPHRIGAAAAVRGR